MTSQTLLELTFRKAVAGEAAQVADMINTSYRGETSRLGWTTEADLLDGLRTDTEEIRRLIAAADSMILLCLDGVELIGSVHVERKEDHAYVGMFVVRPTLQGRGIGKLLLETAEHAVLREWGVGKFVMVVISFRQELIAYYERRGYRRTGRNLPFPSNPAMWTPKVEGLKLELLEKVVRQ